MKTQLKGNKYLVMKSYERGLNWHRMLNTDDLAEALAVYSQKRENEPESDFLLVATLESTIASA